MAKFYRKRPTLLTQHFLDGQDPKRNMHRITQAVVAVGAGIAGALGWKALDVWDTTKQERMAEKDREAASLNAQKDRETDAIQQQKNLDAEDRRHRETLEIENQKNRETRLSDIDYSKNTASSSESTDGFVDSTQIVD